MFQLQLALLLPLLATLTNALQMTTPVSWPQ
jgi:hypothetical protein